MNQKKLEQLIKQKEGVSLEFKEQMYEIFGSGEGKKRQEGELIKDILSLANGNINSAGDVAHLIIGVRDTFCQGTSHIVGIHPPFIQEKELIQKLNEYCYPNFGQIHVDVVEIQGKSVLVIMIPPSPYIYETTKRLYTPKREYDEHTVFIRKNEHVSTASIVEANTIQRMKTLQLTEAQRVHPSLPGAVSGGLLGWFFSKAILENTSKEDSERRTSITVGSIIVGLIVGSSTGSGSIALRRMYLYLMSLPLRERVSKTLALVLFLSGTSNAISRFILQWVENRQSKEHKDSSKEFPS